MNFQRRPTPDDQQDQPTTVEQVIYDLAYSMVTRFPGEEKPERDYVLKCASVFLSENIIHAWMYGTSDAYDMRYATPPPGKVN